MQNRITPPIEFFPSNDIIDGRPVYGLVAVVAARHVYFVTWKHTTRRVALNQLAMWAAETGTPWQLWYEKFLIAGGKATTLVVEVTKVTLLSRGRRDDRRRTKGI